jgi:membrane-associated protease RseP (regulator of RpoE activity)
VRGKGLNHNYVGAEKEMHPVTWLIIGAALFWTIFLILYRKYDLKKRGITFESGMAIFRTQRGLKAIDSFAKKHPTFLLHFGNLALVLGISLSIFVLFNFCYNLYFIFRQPARAIPGATFVFPGLVPGLTIYWWLIAIGILMFVHEISHGLLMRVHGVPTKSVGGLLLGIFPGAFVEPDEEKLAQTPTLPRLRVYSVGPVANILVSLLCLLLILAFLSPKPGVYVWAIRENGPSHGKLQPGVRVLAIDNISLSSVDDLEKLDNFLIKPNDNVRILIENDGKEREVWVVADNFYSENRGNLGLSLTWALPRRSFFNPFLIAYTVLAELRGYTVFHPFVYQSAVPWSLIDMLKWIFVLNLGVGLFNLLPMIPLDGGGMLQAILEKWMPKKKARKYCKYFSVSVLILIILNLLPYFR